MFDISGYFPARFDTSSSGGESWIKIGSADWNKMGIYIGEELVYGNWMIRANASPVPEPSTFLLLGAGLAWLAVWRKKRS